MEHLYRMSGIMPDDTAMVVNKKDLLPPAKELTKDFGLHFFLFPCKNHWLQACSLIKPIIPMGSYKIDTNEQNDYIEQQQSV